MKALSADSPAEAARVLLVDDNEWMLAAAASVLSSSVIVVGAVREGQAALNAARALRPDVIVMDISIPGLNGIEVAKLLRESGSQAAVVFLSVYDDEELIVAARNSGGLGYVVKQRLASDLEVAVREAFAGRPYTSPSQ